MVYVYRINTGLITYVYANVVVKLWGSGSRMFNKSHALIYAVLGHNSLLYSLTICMCWLYTYTCACCILWSYACVGYILTRVLVVLLMCLTECMVYITVNIFEIVVVSYTFEHRPGKGLVMATCLGSNVCLLKPNTYLTRFWPICMETFVSKMCLSNEAYIVQIHVIFIQANKLFSLYSIISVRFWKK